MNDIDCDAVPGGHLHVAHQAKVMSILAVEIKLMRDVFGYKCRLISEQELKSDYLNEVEAHGIDPTRRGETLTVGEFCRLANALDG